MAKGKVTYKTGQNLEPIAQAITSMGQSANKKDKPDVLANKIKAISSDATGVESEMLSGKTFYAVGQKKTGSMVNRGAWTNRLGINSKIVIPQGYHNGQGYIDQSIPTKGAQTYTPSTVNQVINAGQYLSGAQTIAGDPNLIPSNIRKGKTIFGVTGNFFGPTDADYLYWNGNLMNDFTLDSTSVGDMFYQKPNLYGSYIWFQTNSSDHTGVAFNKIFDLSPYSAFDITISGLDYWLTFVFGFSTDNQIKSFTGNSIASYKSYYSAYSELYEYNLATTRYTLDISKLSGMHRLVLLSTYSGSVSGLARIHEMRLR